MSKEYIVRDTAKDIIQGTSPSGLHVIHKNREGRLPKIDPPPVRTFVPPPPMPSPNGDSRILQDQMANLQQQMNQMQRRYEEQLLQEQDARQRLDASMRSLYEKSGDSRGLADQIANLQRQMRDMQNQHEAHLSQEQDARRRLESTLNSVSNKPDNSRSFADQVSYLQSQMQEMQRSYDSKLAQEQDARRRLETSLNSITNRGDGSRGLAEQISALQSQIRDAEGHLSAEQDARRRIESSMQTLNDSLARVNAKAAAGGNTHVSELDSQRQARAALEAQVLRLQQELEHLRGMIDRHSSDLMAINNEVRSRPVVDPNKLNSIQQVEARVRELHGDQMQLRQNLENELNERQRMNKDQDSEIQRLKALMADQDNRRNDIMKQIAAAGSKSNDASVETKRINDKIQLITDEVTKSLMKNEQVLREENNQKYLALEKAIKAELEARLQYERDVRAYLEKKWGGYKDELGQMRDFQLTDRQKYKDKFMKVNEALAVLEQHLEQGNRKIDRVMAAEIQSRKLHEKGLLAKLGEIENRLTGHYTGLNKAIDEAKADKRRPSSTLPNLDIEAIKYEMNAIAGDKHKMTMEGLLKLEEKLARMEKSIQRDTRELQDKMDDLETDTRQKHEDLRENLNRTQQRAQDSRSRTPQQQLQQQQQPQQVASATRSQAQIDPDTIARLKHQIRKLEDMQNEIERSHAQIKERVERQRPEDLDEVSAKQSNLQKQVLDKIDRETQERQTTVLELQDEISKLRNRPLRTMAGEPIGGGGSVDANKLAKMQRDIEECQIGIKKLAESVTTVKNVLSRKLDDESRTRERAVENLEAELESFRGR